MLLNNSILLDYCDVFFKKLDLQNWTKEFENSLHKWLSYYWY